MEKFTEQLFLLQLLHTKVFEPFRNIRDVFLGGNFPGGGNFLGRGRQVPGGIFPGTDEIVISGRETVHLAMPPTDFEVYPEVFH